MLIEGVCINASPLIVLSKSGLHELLPQLFSEIFVPSAVWQEVEAGGTEDPAARVLTGATWARRVDVAVSNDVIISWNLGAGDSAVLSLALQFPTHRAMIDDAAARACARTLGIATLGTGGALVLAKRRGLISSVADALREVQNAGLWLSDSVVQVLLKSAGE